MLSNIKSNFRYLNSNILKLFFVVLFLCFVKVYASVENTLPKNFSKYSEIVIKEVDRHFSSIYDTNEKFDRLFYYAYFSALGEHESCIYLKHSRCWSPKSQFITKWKNGNMREQGAGIAMITRAWRESGILRFDTLRNLKRSYPTELKELNWDNITKRPDLQIRAMILLFKDNYKKLDKVSGSEFATMAMSDSSYNGGIGYVYKDRKKCGLKVNCNPKFWFYNVEKINSRGNKILYGGRTANEINRNHVDDVLRRRIAKYYMYYEKEIESP